MALSAFCTTCNRTVYVEEEHTPVCPVCSTPLLAAVGGDRDDLTPIRAERDEPSDQAGGAK